MAVLCVAAERGGLVKKKEMKVHGLNFKASRLRSGGLMKRLSVTK